MLPYIILFAFISFVYFTISIKTNKKSLTDKNSNDLKKFLYISFFALIIFTGLRALSVGPDTRNYFLHFYRVGNNIVYALDQRFERGYTLLVEFVCLFTDNYTVFFTIVAILVNIPIMLYIRKYSSDCFLSLILYITIGSFTFQLTGLRQALAMSICALAITFAIERKLFHFIGFVVLATLFHKSALLFLPVYLLGAKSVKKKKALLFAIAAAILFLSGEIVIQFATILDYQDYVGDSGVEDGGGWTYIAIMGITLLSYLLNKGKKEKVLEENSANSDSFFFAMVIFALATYLVRYDFRIAERISNYYRMGIIVLLPNTLTKINDPSIRLLAKLACGFLAIALFFYWLMGSKYLYIPFWMYQGV